MLTILKALLKKPLTYIVLAAVAALIVLAACSRSPKVHQMDIQVKCPPETGGSVNAIPEIMMVGL